MEVSSLRYQDYSKPLKVMWGIAIIVWYLLDGTYFPWLFVPLTYGAMALYPMATKKARTPRDKRNAALSGLGVISIFFIALGLMFWRTFGR